MIYQVYSAQLRRRQRRRHRRPRRGLRSRLPYLRDLGVDAIWFSPGTSPMADAGYDVADYRDIDPAFGTLAEAEQLIAEAASWASGPSSTSSRTTAPTSTRGSRRPSPPARLAGAGAVLVPPRPGRGRASCPTNWMSIFAGRPGPGPTNPDGTPASGTCTCSRPSSRTSTGTTPRSARSSRTSCGSGSTAASTASGSTRRRCGQGPGAARGAGATRRPAAPVRRPRRAPRHLPRAGARSPTRYRGDRGPDRRDLAARRRAVRALPAPGRDAHRVQLRLPRPALGRRRAPRRRSTRRSPRTRRSAPRPPGCCPTTT